MEILTIVISSSPYGDEGIWNALRLAEALCFSAVKMEVNVFLIGDALNDRSSQIISVNQVVPVRLLLTVSPTIYDVASFRFETEISHWIVFDLSLLVVSQVHRSSISCAERTIWRI